MTPSTELPRAQQARSREELAAALREGEQPDWLMFWGHRPEPDGSLGPGCLSQWWPAPFTVEGITYPSAEHFMMAHWRFPISSR